MAAPKKTAKPVAKAAETVKVETAAPKAEEKKSAAVAAPKAEEKKEASKAVAVKKEAAPKAEKKTTVKKPAEKAPAKRTTTKKAEKKTTLNVQFAGKSYSQEDLVKIAQDVWKYDLKQKVRELASIDLYVKPEERKVYYVMNQQFTGSFDI